MLEFQSRVLQFKFNGEVVQINYPTVKQLREYSSKFDEQENKVEFICKFLIKLGMKKEICDSLEMSFLEEILMELQSSKK